MKQTGALASFLRVSLFAASAGLSHAQVIFDNLGSANSFNLVNSYVVGAPDVEVAMRFTAGTTALVDYVDLRLWGSGSVNVALLSEAPGARPGSLLEFATVSLPNSVSTTIPFSRADFSNSTVLIAGSAYWLAVSPVNSATVGGWDYTGLPNGLFVFDNGEIGFNDPWSSVAIAVPQAGARIFGAPISAVPESSAYGLIAGGVLLCGALLSRIAPLNLRRV